MTMNNEMMYAQTTHGLFNDAWKQTRKKMLLDTAIELFRNNKKYVEDYIDRNGKMATICGVPVPAVGGSWGEPRRKNHVMFVRR